MSKVQVMQLYKYSAIQRFYSPPLVPDLLLLPPTAEFFLPHKNSTKIDEVNSPKDLKHPQKCQEDRRYHFSTQSKVLPEYLLSLRTQYMWGLCPLEICEKTEWAVSTSLSRVVSLFSAMILLRGYHLKDTLSAALLLVWPPVQIRGAVGYAQCPAL